LLLQGVAWLGRGGANDIKSGFHRAIGAALATGAIALSATAAFFIAKEAVALKSFVDIAFRDPALGRIIDEIANAVSSATF
jgi:hypothetical protein